MSIRHDGDGERSDFSSFSLQAHETPGGHLSRPARPHRHVGSCTLTRQVGVVMEILPATDEIAPYLKSFYTWQVVSVEQSNPDTARSRIRTVTMGSQLVQDFRVTARCW